MMKLLAAAASALLIAAAPADTCNLPGQHRTRTCVKMKSAVVPLRFADGEPTGFYARADDPSKQGGKRPCSEGFVEIDAHEALTTARGDVLYFHPGGGSDHYKDADENGQYGHIAAADLAAVPKLKKSDNGKRAAASGASYYIAPTQIPHDTWYKAEVVNGHSGASYANYGNPGYDKTDGRGDWTYISWSWVQNGGSKYPENINSGGGIVRALGKRDMQFAAAAVEPIIGYSYGADNRANGRVTVIYGETRTGRGGDGSAVDGWLVHSFQRQGEPIVPCVRRAAAETGAKRGMAASPDPLVRMARNLLNEVTVDTSTAQKLRDDWAKRFAEEKSPAVRMEILTEMAQLDDGQTIASFAELLGKESDARVREQVVLLLLYMRSAPTDMKSVCYALLKDFRRSADERERLRIVDATAIVPARESVILLREIAKTLRPGESDDKLRFAVADAVYRLMPRMKVEDQVVGQVRGDLKSLARNGSYASRLQAVRRLAIDTWNERAFLRGLAGSEKSPAILELISKVTTKREVAGSGL